MPRQRQGMSREWSIQKFAAASSHDTHCRRLDHRYIVKTTSQISASRAPPSLSAVFTVQPYCIRFRFRSSSPRGSSSSSDRSAVSLGFKIWAMLPLRVGGADESFSPNPLPSLLTAAPHDHVPKVSAPLLPPPFVTCGAGGGVVGRDCE